MKNEVRTTYARHAVTLPEGELPPTLGLGDPVALAALQPGETVLDLGSGPGRDVQEAARQVGATGRAIGVDFTPEMIERARESSTAKGLSNVAILEGDLERLPVHCGAVDVVISNCVINLVPDKKRALIEAFRALRPGGRLAILDTAFDSDPGEAARADNDSWCACVGGALTVADYEQTLVDIGYTDVRVERIASECGEACDPSDVMSLAVAVTATKPGSSTPSLRPAVPADLSRVEAMLAEAGLPSDGFRVEDAIVTLSDGEVVGAVAVERYPTGSMLRSLVVAKGHRRQGHGRALVVAALEVARWAGTGDVFLYTEDAQRLFATFGFEPVSGTLLKDAVGDSALVSCCTTATAMRLSFEEADLPLLSKPSLKPLPTFQDGACC